MYSNIICTDLCRDQFDDKEEAHSSEKGGRYLDCRIFFALFFVC